MWYILNSATAKWKPLYKTAAKEKNKIWESAAFPRPEFENEKYPNLFLILLFPRCVQICAILSNWADALVLRVVYSSIRGRECEISKTSVVGEKRRSCCNARIVGKIFPLESKGSDRQIGRCGSGGLVVLQSFPKSEWWTAWAIVYIRYALTRVTASSIVRKPDV